MIECGLQRVDCYLGSVSVLRVKTPLPGLAPTPTLFPSALPKLQVVYKSSPPHAWFLPQSTSPLLASRPFHSSNPPEAFAIQDLRILEFLITSFLLPS